MTLILLMALKKFEFTFNRAKLIYPFLILIAMLTPISAASQVIAGFTTISANEGCGSLVVEFQDLSTGSPNTWLWDFGNGNTSTQKNPTAIYSSPGFYDVELRVSDGFSNDSTVAYGFVKVFENPDVEFNISALSSGCVPFDVSFFDVSNNVNSIISWQWDFGDGGSSTMQNPNYTYTSDGDFSVSLLVFDINDCQTLFTETNLITVHNEPTASFDVDISFSCDTTETVNFTNTSIDAVDYFWDFGDGTISVLPNPSHAYTSGNYTVSLCAMSAMCRDTLVITDMISIGEILHSDFIVDDSLICQDQQVNFTDVTLNGPDAWLWDFGDGNTSQVQNPSHTYVNPGTYDISLTTSKQGQCANTFTFPSFIEVSEKPDVQFSVDSSYSCVAPFNVQFFDNTFGAVSWDWVFGNGLSSNLSSPQVSFNDYGGFDVSLLVTNSQGCSEVKLIKDMIKVEDILVDFSLDSSMGCVPLDVAFSDSTNSIRPLVDWSWDFGDGTFSNAQHPTHQYVNPGLYDVFLSVTNDYGCMSTSLFQSVVKVAEPPVVDFLASPLITCVGDDITFTDLSSSTSSLIDTWQWDFGDGGSAGLQNLVYQYQSTGYYDVSLTVGANGCRDTLTFSDYIKIVEPTAIFEEEYDCENPFMVKFDNLSIGADNVVWDFGDGTTSSSFSPTHIFSSRGTYDVVLSVSNSISGCTHDFLKKVTITDPIADFDYLINANHNYEDSVGCAPHEVFLNNQSQDCDYFQVLWSDGYIGYGRVDHILIDPGLIDVSMVITDIHGCKDTMHYDNMYRINDVVADFGVTNVFGCDTMRVDFIDLSTPSSHVLWDFGDGGSSTDNNPQYVYNNQGAYDVILYAESNEGCRDTIKKSQYIEFQYPIADLSVPFQGVCPFEDVTFINLSEGVGISSSWDFGDGNQSYLQDPLHSFNANGVYDITLTVVDSFGCSNSLFLPNYITVSKPVADFTTSGLTSNCPPLISSFSSQSSVDVVNWYWDFNDGGSSVLSDPSHLFSSSGTFDVSLVVENSYGCFDTLVQYGLIDILGPTGFFSISDTVICKDGAVSFFPVVENTDHYFWDFGDGLTSVDSLPVHVYSNEGIFFPSLIIENASGCQFTAEFDQDILVNLITVDAGLNMEVCRGGSIELSAAGNATDFTWIPANTLNNPFISNPIANPLTDMMFYVYHSDGMCEAVDSVFVSVHDSVPDPSFTTHNQCEGDTVHFVANSGISTSNVSYNWSFGGSNQIEDVQLLLGSNIVTLIVENLDNNCTDTITDDVEVFALPLVSFSAPEVCLGEDMFFTDASSTDVVSWLYDFGDGSTSTLQHSAYVYQDHGIYNPSLTVVSNVGCQNSFSLDVQVNELPNPDFSVENACLGEENIFSDMSTITNGAIAFYSFNFGDGSQLGVNANEYHQYDQSGLYDVLLTIVSDKGCFSSVKKQAEVYALPEVDYTSVNYCVNTETHFSGIAFVENSTIVDYAWDFGDGLGISVSQHPYYVYGNPGEYTVVFSSFSDKGCMNSISKEITIFDLPAPAFIVDSEVCVGDEIGFIDFSQANGSSIIDWDWSFGDGTFMTGKKPKHTYMYPGVFDVSLSVYSQEGCKSDTLVVDAVKVFDLPVADFYASSFSVSELNPQVDFYSISQGATLLSWDFDNGQVSTEDSASINFEYPREYNVLLSASNGVGCKSEIIKTVYVNPEYSMFIPNSFSPNGDGDNDVFEVSANAINDFRMIVYDRWGAVVFESNSMNYGWDGLDKAGFLVSPGTYVYHISAYDENERFWVYNGEVNLFR